MLSFPLLCIYVLIFQLQITKLFIIRAHVFNRSLAVILPFNFVCECQRHTKGNHHLYSVNDDSKFLINFTCPEKQLLEWIFCRQLVTSTLDRQHRSLGKKLFFLVCHLWLNGFAIRVTFGSHRSLQLKVSHYTPPSQILSIQNFA